MPIRAVTFDVYSALYDTLASLTQAVATVLSARSSSEDPRALARAWRQKQFEYLLVSNSLDREPASNRAAIYASARFTLRHLVPPLGAKEIDGLTNAWENLTPWPEVPAVLRSVREKPVMLATLSNGDADMLRPLLERLPVEFDHLISTQGGRFKPHPSIYKRTLEMLKVKPGELLHVAGSANDAMGATAAGIPTIWINRGTDPVLEPRYAPRWEGKSLRNILPILEG